MSFIIHHNDDDGRCSAAIIYNDCCMADPSMEIYGKIFEYSHGKDFLTINPEEIQKNDTIYIVDLALDWTIFNFMVNVLHACENVNIVHIDHHQSTLTFIENLDEQGKAFMKKITTMYKIGVSATILCWVYSCMTEDERKHLNTVVWDNTAQFSHIGIGPDFDHLREYRVPMVARFINDWDVWIHELSGTRAFHYGFSLEQDKKPTSRVWVDLLWSTNDKMLNDKYVEPGNAIVAYKDSDAKNCMQQALQHDLEYNGKTIKVLMVNARGDSFLFGDLIKEYDAVCMFWRTAAKWYYSFRSDEEKGVNVAEICESFGGGGHIHAAGFTSDELMFIK